MVYNSITDIYTQHRNLIIRLFRHGNGKLLRDTISR